LYFAAWLDNPVNHYRMVSAVSDNRPFRGGPEDLVYIHQQRCCILANSMKFACSFQTNHTSFTCTHVQLRNLVFKGWTDFQKVTTCFVKLAVFYRQGNHDIPSAFALLWNVPTHYFGAVTICILALENSQVHRFLG